MTSHPRGWAGCSGCDSGAAVADWQPERELPQVGQTYSCANCGHEVYVYGAGDTGHERLCRFRPVTTGMARDLLFFDAVGEWPDQAIDAPLRELPRGAAVDYWMVEREGRSQSAWADELGVSQQAVSKNVAAAREQLDE